MNRRCNAASQLLVRQLLARQLRRGEPRQVHRQDVGTVQLRPLLSSIWILMISVVHRTGIPLGIPPHLARSSDVASLFHHTFPGLV